MGRFHHLRFDELFRAAEEDRLTDADWVEWNELLQNDGGARREYLERAMLQGTLHQRLAPEGHGREEEPAEGAAVGHFVALEKAEHGRWLKGGGEQEGRNGSGVRRWFWPAAAMVMLGATVVLAFYRARPAEVPVAAKGGESAAMVTGMVQVAWEDPGMQVGVNGRLPSQPLHLRSGLLRLAMPSGTEVVVQGPALFQVESGMRVMLERGSMTAHVPAAGVGFAVQTTNATVTDLGTEFGVYVNPADETHAEVFAGRVRVSTEGAGGQESEVLQAGHAVNVMEGRTGIETAACEPLAFVRPGEFGEMLSGAGSAGMSQWLALSGHMRKDPALIAYYDFEPGCVDGNRIRNLASGTAGQSDGVVMGAKVDAGRMAGKQALRFDGSSRIDVNIPGNLPAVTMAAWINAENIGKLRDTFARARTNAFSSILMTDGARPGALHWQLQNGVRTELGISVSDSATVPFSRYRSMDLLSQSDDGRWMFVAVTIDHEGGKIRHYLNGVVAGRNNENFQDGDLSIGDAAIGNWNPLQRTDHPNRGFVGRIDEVAVFRRVLSAEEIAAIYAAGRGG